MKRLTFFVIIILSLASTAAYSQVTLQAGGGLGAVIPAGDFGGTTIEYYSGTKFGLSTGYSLHGKGRVGIGPVVFMGELGYASLSNSGESEPGQGKVNVSQKIISFKVGPEYHIDIPVSPLTVYFGANLGLNIFDGETEFRGVSQVPSGTYSVNTGTRVGVGFNAGLLFSLGPLTSLDVSVQYNLMNLMGKKWEDVDVQDRRLDSYLSLNDDKDPLFAPNNSDHFIQSSREIHTVGITASLMFGL